MITCMSQIEMAYFISLLGDIVSVVGTSGDTIVVRAEQGDIYWQKTGEAFCRILQAKS